MKKEKRKLKVGVRASTSRLNQHLARRLVSSAYVCMNAKSVAPQRLTFCFGQLEWHIHCTSYSQPSHYLGVGMIRGQLKSLICLVDAKSVNFVEPHMV